MSLNNKAHCKSALRVGFGYAGLETARPPRFTHSSGVHRFAKDRGHSPAVESTCRL